MSEASASTVEKRPWSTLYAVEVKNYLYLPVYIWKNEYNTTIDYCDNNGPMCKKIHLVE